MSKELGLGMEGWRGGGGNHSAPVKQTISETEWAECQRSECAAEEWEESVKVSDGGAGEVMELASELISLAVICP